MAIYKHGYEDFEWMVGLNRYSLKAIGCWPDESENELLMDAYVLWIILMVVFGNMVPQLYALTMVINELPLIMDNGFVMMALTMGLVETIILWRNKKKLMLILATMRSDCLKWKEDWEREVMLSTATQGRFFTICGYFMVSVSAVSVIFGPIVGWNFRIINNITDFGDRNLPTQTYYPFDYTITPYFEITYAIQVLSLTFAAIGLTSPVALFSSVVSYSCGQISILGLKVSDLSNFGRITDRGVHHGFAWKLKGIVDEHTRIIRTVQKIESIFKYLVLSQVIAGSVIICCLGFQIVNTMDRTTESPPFSQIMFLSLIFSTETWLMFVYCLAGETLAHHCDQLHRKICDTDWYSWPSRNALDLMHLMIETKEPLNLSAGQFFSLNYQSFTSILNTIAGYVSMLIAVHKK